MGEFFGGLIFTSPVYDLLDAFTSSDGLGVWVFWALTGLYSLMFVASAVSSDDGAGSPLALTLLAIFWFGLIWNKPQWIAVGYGADIIMMVVLGALMGVAVMRAFKGSHPQGIEAGAAILSGWVGIPLSTNMLRVIGWLGWHPFVAFKDMAAFLGGTSDESRDAALLDSLLGIHPYPHGLLGVFKLASLAIWDTFWLFPGVLAVGAASWMILSRVRSSRQPI